jgi:hypothetical protein
MVDRAHGGSRPWWIAPMVDEAHGGSRPWWMKFMVDRDHVVLTVQRGATGAFSG